MNPTTFIAARDELASEARRAGDRGLATAIRKLRKPSAGAAVANLLVREQPREIERLIKLGESLRDARDLDGARLRRATKEKADTVNKLLQQARALAVRSGLQFSQSIERELESTLDAAFSDPDGAQSLRDGCLTNALHYSGLGFGVGAAPQGSAPPSGGPRRARDSTAGKETAKAKESLEQARSEAKQAASGVEKARRAVTTAEADLQRLRAALTVATRRATKASEKESDAQKKLDLLRGKRSRS